MNLIRTGIAALMVATVVAPVHAQGEPDALTPAQTELACAPPAAVAPPAASVARVLGAQDTLPHTILSPQDLLVIRGGTGSGLQLGQRFFIRRAPAAYGGYAGRSALAPMIDSASTITAGWLRIVALNDTTSLARIDHACGAIFVNDYLEPFAAPAVPPDVDGDDSTGELDFTELARVVAAAGSRMSAGPGEYVVIDRGTDRGLQPGGRLAIFRDLRIQGMPMMAVGEAVVMSTAKDRAVIRINRARDAVWLGDYLVPRKTAVNPRVPSLE